MKDTDRRIKILSILGSANIGGTELMTSRLIAKMSSEFLNSVCFLSKKGPVGEELENQGILHRYCYKLSKFEDVNINIFQAR
jgi:hypothetical protein